MKAIICAAGRGARLGADRCKVLLEIGGRTLLEWHVQHLRDAGISEIVLVTGHRREDLAPFLSRLHLREVVNPRFCEGSVLSLAVVLPEIRAEREPFLLMDADVLYPAAMLRRLLKAPAPTVLLIDREYSTADDDPVLVPVKDGRPFDFVKQWQGEADFVGESVGFFKIGPADLPLLVAEIEARSRGEGVRDSYDDVLRAMVQAGRFAFEDVTALPWTEIDFPDDLERARKVVFPAIQQLS